MPDIQLHWRPEELALQGYWNKTCICRLLRGLFMLNYSLTKISAQYEGNWQGDVEARYRHITSLMMN